MPGLVGSEFWRGRKKSLGGDMDSAPMAVVMSVYRAGMAGIGSCWWSAEVEGPSVGA